MLPVREWTDFFSLASRSFGDNVFVSDGEGVDKLRPVVPPSVRNLRFGVGNRTKRHNPFAWNTQMLTWLVRCDELLPAAGIDAVAYCGAATPRREREAGASRVGRCAVRGPAPLRVVTD